MSIPKDILIAIGLSNEINTPSLFACVHGSYVFTF